MVDNKKEMVKQLLLEKLNFEHFGINKVDDIVNEIDNIYYDGLWILEKDGTKRKASMNDILTIAKNIYG